MFVELEEALRRELREVADGLQIPALPPLPQEASRAQRHWPTLLVAAAVVLIVAGVVAVVGNDRAGQRPDPAPSPPSPTESVATIPRTPPTVPYVLDQRLYVGGQQVPGTWWSVRGTDAGWLGQRPDNTWWWGRGPDATQIPVTKEDPAPAISPTGRYVAAVDVEKGILSAHDIQTDAAWGGGPFDLGGDSGRLFVLATDDGKVIVQGPKVGLLWLPLADDETVDLTVTAPGQLIRDSSPAGVVAGERDYSGEPSTAPYLAEFSDAGELTRIVEIPEHDDVQISPSSDWLVYTPAGTTGGEAAAVATLQAQTVDGAQRVTLTPPVGWVFSVRSGVWEDDDYFVSPVLKDFGDGERMVRCSVVPARCVLIQTH